MASILKVDTIQDQSGNNIINENADTITIGASGDTVNVVGTLQNNGSALAGGITVADQWYLTASFSTSGADITANLSQNTGDGRGTIGTAMTESSGIFSFPSTGIYLVTFEAHIESSSVDSRYIAAAIYATTDNSTYNQLGYSGTNLTNQSDARDAFAQISLLIDVTDTSLVKVKFNFGGETTVSLAGAAGTTRKTTFTFIRLGDT